MKSSSSGKGGEVGEDQTDWQRKGKLMPAWHFLLKFNRKPNSNIEVNAERRSTHHLIPTVTGTASRWQGWGEDGHSHSYLSND